MSIDKQGFQSRKLLHTVLAWLTLTQIDGRHLMQQTYGRYLTPEIMGDRRHSQHWPEVRNPSGFLNTESTLAQSMNYNFPHHSLREQTIPGPSNVLKSRDWRSNAYNTRTPSFNAEYNRRPKYISVTHTFTSKDTAQRRTPPYNNVIPSRDNSQFARDRNINQRPKNNFRVSININKAMPNPRMVSQHRHTLSLKSGNVQNVHISHTAGTNANKPIPRPRIASQHRHTISLKSGNVQNVHISHTAGTNANKPIPRPRIASQHRHTTSLKSGNVQNVHISHTAGTNANKPIPRPRIASQHRHTISLKSSNGQNVQISHSARNVRIRMNTQGGHNTRIKLNNSNKGIPLSDTLPMTPSSQANQDTINYKLNGSERSQNNPTMHLDNASEPNKHLMSPTDFRSNTLQIGIMDKHSMADANLTPYHIANDNLNGRPGSHTATIMTLDNGSRANTPLQSFDDFRRSSLHGIDASTRKKMGKKSMADSTITPYHETRNLKTDEAQHLKKSSLPMSVTITTEEPDTMDPADLSDTIETPEAAETR